MEFTTKKALFAGVAAFALLVQTAGAEGGEGAKLEVKDIQIRDVSTQFRDVASGGPGNKNAAVSSNTLSQVVSNQQNISAAGGEGGGNFKDFVKDGMKFGPHTFDHQVLDVNNFQQGVNQAQQGAVSIAVSVTDRTQ